MKRLSMLFPALTLVATTAMADITPTYSLGYPSPAKIHNSSNLADNEWLSANPYFVPTAGFVATPALSTDESLQASESVMLAQSEAGFSFERSKPEYYLADKLEPPENVDWAATYKRFVEIEEEGGPFSGGFLFNNDDSNPCVYVADGGTRSFEWILSDGRTNSIMYVLGSTCKGRPKRIYWTDHPYNGPQISLQGKFVKFFGDPKIAENTYGTVTNVVGGSMVEQKDVVISGLYLDTSSMTLSARGRLTGQVLMAYYDSGNYDKILHVQVVEVCQPDVIVNSGIIGSAIKPNGRGYDIDGLQAMVSAGISYKGDDRGDFLYQHFGQYSYSPKNGYVYALRPTKNERWNAEVYWMETDPMNVSWPFEVDQYNIDWPDVAQTYVRGDIGEDFGAAIHFPTNYEAKLQTYQEPDGHARAVDENNDFTTVGTGLSLVKLEYDDNVWFMPIKSVARSDASYYTLKPSRVNVGDELMLRSGSRSGVVNPLAGFASASLPGYVYKPASAEIYDSNIYSETNSASAIYAIADHDNTGNDIIEVWWSAEFNGEVKTPENPQGAVAERNPSTVLPVPVAVPVLPERYRAVWPELTDAPQIIIASQEGSANKMSWANFGAAYLDSTNSVMKLADRSYFGTEGGTFMFWTRGAHYNDSDSLPYKPSGLCSLDANNGSRFTLAVAENDGAPCLSAQLDGSDLIRCPLPAVSKANEWIHIAVVVDGGVLTLYLNGLPQGTASVGSAFNGGIMRGNTLGAFSETNSASGREFSEVVFYSKALSAEELAEAREATHSASEDRVSGYYSFRSGEDLNSQTQIPDTDERTFLDRVGGETCIATHVAYTSPGAPTKSSCIIQSDTEPKLYYQNDPSRPGYNPNDEHAFIRAGSGGYVAWALRCDLGTDNTPPPGVFVEYTLGGRNRLQFFHVLPTNEDWPELAAPCTAGELLPGPHPIDLFDNPWLPEDKWDNVPGGAGVGIAYRDRKKQIWARAEGTLPIYMYYAMQDGFYFPALEKQPEVGTPIPWLACLDSKKADPLNGKPARWTWNISWPMNVPEMKIGQTLTVAEAGLPEVWNAKSISVVFPDPEDDLQTVMLTDPTVVQSVPFMYSELASLGLSTDKNGGLAYMKGKYYFTELPPALSSRLYVDATNNKLCLTGERVEKNAGVSILYPNVLSDAEREAILNLPNVEPTANWREAIAKLAAAPVQPNKMSRNGAEISTTYLPVDHYALTALGATNYVVLIENDATDDQMSKEDGIDRKSPVAEGDAINMRVIKVVPEYYTGRIVTREDEVNLLSQRLSIVYTEAFGGKADDFEFEWKSSSPSPDGSVPTDYDNGYLTRPVRDDLGEKAAGLTRFVIGQQGDTLANMVNKYWICRYRAVPDSPAFNVMGSQWSDWCAPPALAEGWVQRVLNNITPFNQRMTDMYENKAETAVSMLQQAGGPYNGDVALNQDNLTSVGLIQLYETLLNKAESMSLTLGINDADANKQLLLAVERLGDLYKVLGDEAYSDAKNPTIGFGMNLQGDFSRPTVDFGAESSSLFCFDNQVNSLLDEELALLRGRTGASAPSTQIGPYYNRLLWNFTKGITAGEVAYAVNYDISGTETIAFSEEQAARLYPQGHGDAYGHYLSALKGWYRLLRNPYFSWGRPTQTEMVVADAAVNVDYYEEAKFAEAAADLARTAADVVDLTARKAWRDGGELGGYLDKTPERAFGYGEWASRGAYGALVNWVTANSILPAAEAAADEFSDEGLSRIDRGTVGELADICTAAADIQRMVDRMDEGLNPLGLSDNAIPFDISPVGVGNGTQTHFEQVRDRAKTALSNARAILDRAQTQSNRMRMIEEAAHSYSDAIASEEEDYNNELINIFGTPYSDDIGPSGTYKQGYEGPDLIHYMWMDFEKFGLDDIESKIATNVVRYKDIGTYHLNVKLRFKAFADGINAKLSELKTNERVVYELTSSGLVKKPDNITGNRRVRGSVQEKYGDFLLQYTATQRALESYDNAVNELEWETSFSLEMFYLYTAKLAIMEGVQAYLMYDEIKSRYIKKAINYLEYIDKLQAYQNEGALALVPEVMGAGMTVVTSPRSYVKAALAPSNLAMGTSTAAAEMQLKNLLIGGSIGAILSKMGAVATYGVEYNTETKGLLESVKSRAKDVNTSVWELDAAVAKLNQCVEAFNAEVARGEQILDKREAARKRQVNRLSQLRYNEMLFRKLRDKTLTRYSAAFDLAQKYVFMAAQVYGYETAMRMESGSTRNSFAAKILATRALGAFDASGEPIVADNGDLGLAGYLAQMDQNWLVLKPRLGINNPQPYATWFSLRSELFRILPDKAGDSAWATELTKYWRDDIKSDPMYKRYCQPFQSQFGLKDVEPGLVIPFETTIDFAKNLFGNDLAGGDHAYDSSWYSTRIAAAGVWFDGYNAASGSSQAYAQPQLAQTPVVYLVPVGSDRMRSPGLEDGTFWNFSVVDQVIPAPFAISRDELDNDDWQPSFANGDYDGVDSEVKIRKHPSFRAYYGEGEPSNVQLDATRLIGRSVWNTRWLLVIPAGAMNADRDKALSTFINGFDSNRDGKLDQLPVRDIRIGFKTYSQSGN